MDSKTYGEEYLTYTHTDSAKLINALAEIERLTELCKEYRENGDRLMRVADEYKAEIERLNQHAVDVYKLNRESYLKMQQEIDALKAEQEAWRKFTDMANTTCDRKDAALRVALDALEYHTIQTRPIHSTDVAIATLREAL